jgi:hypothetical protein
MRQGMVMAEIAIHNVRDLGQDARRALEALLGRRLAEEEQVSVTALAARPAPSGDERRIAAERLLESLKAMSESARAIPHDELESLIDEAMDDVRRRRS